MFEAKLEQLLADLGPDRFLAAYLATGARNGVEDLHASGAFTDAEAPTFNRAMRQALYEAWVALRESANEQRANAQSFVDVCWEILEELDEDEITDDSMEDVLAAACHRAARQFMEDKGAAEADALEFADAAMEEMRSYYRVWDSVVSGVAGDEEARLFDFAVGLIASYWEPAQLSDGFAALL